MLTAAFMLSRGCRNDTSRMPKSGRAAATAPPADQETKVMSAARRASAAEIGDVSAAEAASTAVRAGKATAAAAGPATAGYQAKFRGPLLGGGAPAVAVGGKNVASLSPLPVCNGHPPMGTRPVVGGAALSRWVGASMECHTAARPAPPRRAATRSPSAATTTARKASGNQ